MRAAANSPNPKVIDKNGNPETWEIKYGHNELIRPYILPDNKGIMVDKTWPRRQLRFPTKPYKVCIMSTCGMMCPRSVIEELGPWHPEHGIYSGGESYANLKQSTCGYHHWIHPKSIIWHFAEKRGYQYWHADFVRNEQIASYINGGEEALEFCIQGRGGSAAVRAIADDVREKCREEREYIKERQVETLEDYFARWIKSPGVWK